MAKNPFAPAVPVAKKLKILLYGPSGSGKTLAALSFPRVAIVDAEGGTDLYAGRPGIAPFSVLRIKTLTELESALAFIEDDQGRAFDTLVIDPITVFYDVQKDAASKRNKAGELGFKEWGTINTRMKALYTRLTNLPVHVVGIARESVEYETVNGQLNKIGVKPDADKTLVYIFDFVVRMNANHSGSVVKSRGLTLGNHGALAEVNWSAFEGAASAYLHGETVKQISESDAAATEAEDLRDKDTATAFMMHWRAQSITDQNVLAALGVEKLSQWEKGRAAADEAVNAWLAAKLSQESA